MTALDARVARLMSSIDSDASLNMPGTSIVTRVAEMERLLNAVADTKSSSGDTESTTSSLKTPMGRAKLFALPAVKSLVAALDVLNVVPLDYSKVIGELLTNMCPLGTIWMSGVHIEHVLFEKLLPCREKAQIVAAFKRLMCKTKGTIKMDEFDRFDNKAGECPLPHMMVMGTFATSKGLHFNPWLDICVPRIAVVDGGPCQSRFAGGAC